MTISLTIPNEYSALTHAAEMLTRMAADLAPKTVQAEQPAASIEQITPAEVNAGTLIDSAEASVATPTPEDIEAAACDRLLKVNGPTTAESAFAPKPESAGAVTEQAGTTANLASAAAPATVDLDSKGRPHDPRIHSGSKTKLSKGGGWKLKRGLDKEFVATVEAELDALMVVPVATSAPVPEASQAPVPEASQAPVPTPDGPVPTPGPASGNAVSTFPELVAAITTQGKTDAEVLAACKAAGVAAFPLLGSRPDLVPTVAKVLGLA